jgi:Fic family protein
MKLRSIKAAHAIHAEIDAARKRKADAIASHREKIKSIDAEISSLIDRREAIQNQYLDSIKKNTAAPKPV